MEHTEDTVRGPESFEERTVLDLDTGATVIEADEKTEQSKAPAADADQQTLYAHDDFSESDEVETRVENPNTRTIHGLPSIKRLFTGEEVVFSKSVFCIGRKDDVDYAVSHNPAISRKHAEIITRSGRYYIRDLGAKNRTYVNGKLLPARSEAEISNGDVIKLANEDFLVQL